MHGGHRRDPCSPWRFSRFQSGSPGFGMPGPITGFPRPGTYPGFGGPHPGSAPGHPGRMPGRGMGVPRLDPR